MKSETHKYHLQVGGVRRRYLVYPPPGYDGRTLLPVVLLFHGTGATVHWTLRETKLADKADEAGFLLVLPEGVPADLKRPAGFLENPAYWKTGPSAGDKYDDLAFIGALLEELPRKFTTDPRRSYVTGFSNGASFAFEVAARFCERIAAVAPVAGYCADDQQPLRRPVPTLYIVGAEDPLAPLEARVITTPWGYTLNRPRLAENWQRWAVALGCPPEPEPVRDEGGVRLWRYGPGREGVEMLCHVIAGHGHHWPGGRGELTEEIAGPKVAFFNANDVIWEFFEKISL